MRKVYIVISIVSGEKEIGQVFSTYAGAKDYEAECREVMSDSNEPYEIEIIERELY